ncbi:MAG TPA: LLM class flavin-dependent oxidoreductase [Acidimicrobiales bacterium]|nr:LLM class flavin-dependent oxidoreductase [Acidimicrobiales bacterium]
MAADHPVEFGIYVPQVGFTHQQIMDRVQVIERLDYHSVWFFDHFYGPGLPDLDAYEGWTLASWVLAATTRLRVGHLVLCSNFRHPALLAKMATSLDVLSGGRLDLGIGSGSVEIEHHQTGLPWGPFAERSERLGETLAILTAMFSGEPTSFEGRFYQLDGVPNRPPPVQSPRPPIHVGGMGPKHTLPLVARYADVWNVPTYGLVRWEESQGTLVAECEKIGRDPAEIRKSHEAVLVLTRDEASLPEAKAKALRRYGGPGWGMEEGGYIGTPPMVVEHIAENVEKGITLFVFFTYDRAATETLELFAEEVMPAFA